MTNDSTDSTIISCIIHCWIEERRLENSCREVNTIGCWVIVSINRLWSHVPFLLINRLTPAFSNTILHSCFLYSLHVFNQWLIVINHENAIHILPFIRITDLNIKCLQLLYGFFLCCSSHPCVLFDTLCKSILEVLHQCNHTLLTALREVFLYVELTYSLTHDTLYERQSTLPTWLLLLNTICHLGIFKVTIREVIRQHTCRTWDNSKLHVGFQCV